MPQQRIVVAGGHGKIASHFIRMSAARGDVPVALVRRAEHTDEVASWGAQPEVLDLENATLDEVARVVTGATAVIFAAGAGPGSGVARKDSVDRGAAVLLADASERAGVRRFIQISAFGAGEPVAAGADETWTAYIEAKSAAEEDLRIRPGLDWTILRPGLLTDDEPTGAVSLTRPPLARGSVTRADVAAVLIALLDAPATAGMTLMLTEGSTPIADAVVAL